MPEKTIASVLVEHKAKLMALRGITGVAIGSCSGEPCIKVYVAQKNYQLLQQIPSTLEGYRVDVEETGEFRALGTQ